MGRSRTVEGKVVIVTGAASGIGRATAARLLADGAVGRRAPTSRRRADDLGDGGGPTCRPTSPTRRAVAALVAAAVAAAAVASTASSPRPAWPGGGLAHQVDADEWHRVIGVNLTGTFFVAKHVIGQLLAQEPVDGERGSIVTIASIEGLEGTAGGSAYNASKGGVVLLTKNLAIDYGPSGIRANAICPGFIETPMTGDLFGMPGMEEVAEGYLLEHALRRYGQPEEIAAAAALPAVVATRRS